jgi:parallel beta-helix repeat protein
MHAARARRLRLTRAIGGRQNGGHMKKLLTIAAITAAILAATILGGAERTSAIPYVITPAAMGPWSLLNYDASLPGDIGPATTPSGTTGSFVVGPPVPPAGTGSAVQSIGSNGGDATRLVTSLYNGLKLTSIASLRYWTYVSTPGSGGQATYLQLRIDRDSDGIEDDRLFFEPVYQNGTYATLGYSGPIPAQCGGGCVTVGGWQTWDARVGGWWSMVDSAGGPPLTTLAGYVTAYPLARLATDSPAFRIQAGGGAGAWDNFVGSVDRLLINADSHDFEPPSPACSVICYVRNDGNDANPGTANTPALAKRTIQAAVNQVDVGGTVSVEAGIYVENVSLAKRITLDGAGSGSGPGDTIVRAAAPGSPTIDVDGDASTGISPANRLTFRDLRITSASGGSGPANSGMRITGSVSTRWVTFSNVASVLNSGHGISFDTTGSVFDVEVLSATLSDNGNAGFSIRSNVPSFDQLTILGGSIEHNAIQGIITGASGSPGVTNVEIDGTTFTGNGTNPTGGEGDLQFFLFNGNATIRNVNIAADAHSAIQFRGKDAALAPAGTIILHNLSITGSPTYGMQLQRYSSIAGVSMSDVDIATTGTFGLYLFDLLSNLDINDTEIGANTFSIANVSVADVDATGATFTGAADNFAIEDRVGHAIDAPGGGLVTWVADNVFVTPSSFSAPFTTFADIQRGVNEVTVNGNVNVAPGVFNNNVNVNKSVHIIGQGQGVTTVHPALSSPNPCGGGSLCGGSHVFLVAADDVEIRNLAVDGDNPSLTSGVVIGGADVDARNGIIENHSTGAWDNTHLHDLTVRNIYLRGIQVGSGGNNFNVHHNTVENVNGEAASIAIFNFGGSGAFTGNVVDNVNDGIASNWSRGTVYTGNAVTDAGSGIHTDNNGGSGGVSDVIEDNSVADCKPAGFGIWTFAPFVGPTVNENTVSNCAVGLAAAGNNGAGSVVSTFTVNLVDGAGLAGSTGVYTTTSRFGFGDTDVDAIFTGNVIINNDDGFFIETTPGALTNTTVANFNEISNNANSGATASGPGTFDVDLAGNWWGNDTGPSHGLNVEGTANAASDNVAYSPWLGFGDASGAQGFQLASPMTWFANPDICYQGSCIQRAVDFASNGDTIKSKTGTFPEIVTINKSLIVTSASDPVIDGGGADAVTITADDVTFNDYEVVNGTNGIVIASGADNATITNNVVNTFTSAGLRGLAPSSGHDISLNTITGPHTGSCMGGFWGMHLSSVSGDIDQNTISGIGNGITTGCQEGRAIEAIGAGTLSITNNDISLYQKSGIIVRDTVNSTITGNETVGEGASAIIAMNGITVTSTGTTIIDDNDTSGHRYTPEPTFSCGILTFSTVQITNNRSNGNDEVGICALGGHGSVISGNDVTGHTQRGIYVDDALNVNVDDNDVDGAGGGTTANSGGLDPDADTRYYGIYVIDSSGNITNNRVKGITHGAVEGGAFGLQSGVGIRVNARPGGASDVDITGNEFTGSQKNGMVITNVYGGMSVHADIDDNLVTGTGPSNIIAQNGIQVSNDASATITRNDVSGHDYVPFTAAAVGLLIIEAGTIFADDNDVHDNMEGMYVQQTDNAIVTNNVFTDNYDASIFIYLSDNGIFDFNEFNGVPTSSYGIYVYDASTGNRARNNEYLSNAYGVIVDYSGPGAPTGNEFNDSDFIGNAVFGLQQTGTLVGATVDAEDNWWNACDGPSGAGPGSGDAVSTNVDFTPFDHAACDSDSDLLTDGAEDMLHLTDYLDADTDDDGCADGEEVLFTPFFGGGRSPIDQWDFYDVGTDRGLVGAGDENLTKDRKINFQDALILLDHFGHNGTDAHDHDFDRYIPDAMQPWRTAEETAGGDSVTFTDVLANLESFGHDCSGAP